MDQLPARDARYSGLMDSSLPLLAALIGLLSTAHCWSMCGGLLAAFSATAPVTGAAGVRRSLDYNLGRITSYALAGALAGGAVQLALDIGAAAWGHRAVQGMAALVLIASGFALMDRLPGKAWLQRAGLALWRRLQPLTRPLLPARDGPRRFLLGMLWGWLPCGFVYSMLAMAAAQGSAAGGAAIMAAFGLGTLPGMLFAQQGFAQLRHRFKWLPAPALGAWLLVFAGVGLLWMQAPWDAGGGHAHHHVHH